MTVELASTLTLFASVAILAIIYGIRVTLKGQVHYDRVDRQGGSPLLSKSIMEVGYWFFQPLARLLIFCHVTANQISWASLAFGVLAGVCLAFGHFGSGAVFSAISAVMDSLDGIVARMTRQSSDAGEVLDATVDRYVEFLFLGGLTVYYREIPACLILCLFALVGSFMVSYSTAKAEALHIDPPKGAMRRPERALYLTLGAALSPVTIPLFETYRDFPIAIAHPMLISVCLVAVMANFSAIERLWFVAKMMRLREEKQKVSSAQIPSDPSIHSNEEVSEHPVRG